eukprot:Pgem_evm1s18175
MSEKRKAQNPSGLKCKAKRSSMYKKYKEQKRKEKKDTQEERKRKAEELGDDAPPKKIP